MTPRRRWVEAKHRFDTIDLSGTCVGGITNPGTGGRSQQVIKISEEAYQFKAAIIPVVSMAPAKLVGERGFLIGLLGGIGIGVPLGSRRGDTPENTSKDAIGRVQLVGKAHATCPDIEIVVTGC